jgi:hypothetical protein
MDQAQINVKESSAKYSLGESVNYFTLKELCEIRKSVNAKFDKIYFTIDGVLYVAEKAKGMK